MSQAERETLLWLVAKYQKGENKLDTSEIPPDCPVQYEPRANPLHLERGDEDPYAIFASLVERDLVRWSIHDDKLEILPAAVTAADELNRGPDYLARWTDSLRRNRLGATLLVGVIAAPILVQWIDWIWRAVTLLLARP